MVHKLRFYLVRLSLFVVFVLLLSAISLTTLEQHYKAYADPPRVDPIPCNPNHPAHIEGDDTDTCQDETVEAVQNGLLSIESIMPSQLPKAGGSTTYTVSGKTIEQAVREGFTDYQAALDKSTPVPFTDLTLTSDNCGGVCRDEIDGFTVTWGGLGKRWLTVTYDTGHTPIEGNEGIPTHLAKSFEVNIVEETVAPPAGSGSGTSETDGICSITRFTNQADCEAAGGKWTAQTGVAVGVIIAIVVLLLVLAFLLLFLLKRRRRDEGEDVPDVQGNAISGAQNEDSVPGAHPKEDYGIISKDNVERKFND